MKLSIDYVCYIFVDWFICFFYFFGKLFVMFFLFNKRIMIIEKSFDGYLIIIFVIKSFFVIVKRISLK